MTDASPDLQALARTGPVHFVGIAGAGMSALAELVLRGGGRVTGCDAHPGEVGTALEALGADVLVGHDPRHVEDAVAVVATAAVPAEHAELAAARERRIPVMKRAQALGALVNRGTVVAICGTHGKTTTTAMATAILAEAGFNPTGFVGGRVPAWGGGLRAGSPELFVVEADEYDRSFHTLRPRAVAVTSLEADHLDVYGSLEGVVDAFRRFLTFVPEDGLVAGCADDPNVHALVAELPQERTLLYGIGTAAALRATEIAADGRGSRFQVSLGGEHLGELTVGVPGLHNVRNALGALAVARHIGAGFDASARALAAFRGVARRFEAVGEVGGALVIDDYAHHPTEIEATIATARVAHPDRRVVAVFQPHLYTRTRDFAVAFGRALAKADAVWVTDVYPAREAAIEGVSGRLVADAARAAGAGEVHYEPTLRTLEQALRTGLQPGELCVVMGAGDIDTLARALGRRPGEEGTS